MNKKTITSNGNEGFIILPRKLIKKALFSIHEPVSEEMALLILLYLCSYSDQNILKRGDTQFSVLEWSRIFHWNLTQTRRFFDRLLETGELSKRFEGNKRVLHVARYEEICGKYAAHPSARNREKEKKLPTKTEQNFELFWERYYEVNHEIEPSDKELAWKEWKKLTAGERLLAYEHIYDYFLSMKDINHSKKAYNYLRHKSFIF